MGSCWRIHYHVTEHWTLIGQNDGWKIVSLHIGRSEVKYTITGVCLSDLSDGENVLYRRDIRREPDKRVYGNLLHSLAHFNFILPLLLFSYCTMVSMVLVCYHGTLIFLSGENNTISSVPAQDSPVSGLDWLAESLTDPSWVTALQVGRVRYSTGP